MQLDAVERRRLFQLVKDRAAFDFSNFEWCQIHAFGLEWPTLEHAYQAAKFTDKEVRILIWNCQTPGEAKRRSRDFELRANWDGIKLGIMDKLIQQKFAVNTKFAVRLVATDLQEIIEWNTWHDNFWGRCVCERCKGDGENWLGKLIMIQRSRLMYK